MRYYHIGLNLTKEIISWNGQHIKPQSQSNAIPVTKEEYIVLYTNGYFNNQVTKKGSDGEILLLGIEYIQEKELYS